ncbi:MAG: efflux RND transporter periplasmic adaptor subunit [Bacteroidales bacterium]
MKMKSLSVVVLTALCFFSCGKKEEAASPVRPVKVTTVTSRNEIRKDYSGVVDVVKFVNLAFRVPGQIIQLPIVEGQKVKQGDLIAQIDPREIKLQYEAAKAAYETAKAQLERNTRLLERQAVSQQEMEIVRSNYEQARSNFEAQQNNMSDTYLRAPFTGSITKRAVENYQRVNAGETIAQLIDSKDLQIYFTIPDNSLALLQGNNKSFTVEFEVYKGIKFSAILKEYVEASPDGTGIPVFLTINDPRFDKDKYDIKSGFSCNVTMIVNLDNKSLEYPYVPLTAVFGSPENNQQNVWVYNTSTGTVSKRPIQTGSLVDEGNVLVTSGLKNGEIVVTAGVTQIIEGETVKILK